MPLWLQICIELVGGIVTFWLLLVALLCIEQRRHSNRLRLLDLLRVAPDVIRLMKRPTTDPSLPIRVRLWLGILLVYLISPIDLIPDFIPVLGYVDDALIVAIALRAVIRCSGTAAINQHWPGSPAGLAAVLRLAVA